jgi:ATP-dependent DNA helicase DinG
VVTACVALAGVDVDAGGTATLADLIAAMLDEMESAFEFVRRASDDDWVYHLDFSGPGSTLRAIVAVPLDVGAVLQRLVHLPERAVVYTSATLFVGADADYVRRRLGLPATVRQLAVPSPFDYASQCTVARTASLGDYRDPEFVPGLAAVIESLHRTTRRRMLVLLTSHAMLRELHEFLVERLGADAPLFAQGVSGDRSALAARLEATPAGLLLGTASFWEGVDFPGTALEILVLCKLPFAPPDDPLVEARCERLRAHGEDAFTDFVLPEAVLRFRQGFGRLIRTRRDRGAVLLLDGRLETRAYGETFVGALPVATTSFATPEALVAHVHTWFESGHDA